MFERPDYTRNDELHLKTLQIFNAESFSGANKLMFTFELIRTSLTVKRYIEENKKKKGTGRI